MKMIDILLAEMDQEAQSTARVLERIPVRSRRNGCYCVR